MKKLFLTLIAFLTTHKAIAAATATAITAAATASVVGVDPWPWVIGGFGAAVVYVKRPATSRPDAIINAAISVMIGGVGSPWAAAVVSKYFSPDISNQYFFALALSCLWPWVVPAVMQRLQALTKSATLPSTTDGEK